MQMFICMHAPACYTLSISFLGSVGLLVQVNPGGGGGGGGTAYLRVGTHTKTKDPRFCAITAFSLSLS